MSLISYLTDYFQGDNGTYENQAISLVQHFKDKFGVNVKVEGNLFNFKYDMLDAKWSYPLTRECRGAIFLWDGAVWIRKSRPWDKFFNQHEGYCPLFEKSVFEQRLPNLSAWEKMDGTAIQIFDNKNKWHATTLGTITAGNVGDHLPGVNFDALFWNTFGIPQDQFPGIDNHTHMFELCTNENRIVTKYPKNITALLSVRNNETGEYLDIYALDEFLAKLHALGANVRLPSRTFFAYENVKTFAEIEAWIESNTADDDIEFKEGFVIYDGAHPICKMKCARYLQLHHAVGGGDPAHTRKVVIESFFTGTIDDVEKVLNDPMLAFLETVRFRYANVVQGLTETGNLLKQSDYPTKKDWALAVQKHADKRFTSFFYSNFENIIAPKSDVDQLARDWLKESWFKLLDFWKGTV